MTVRGIGLDNEEAGRFTGCDANISIWPLLEVASNFICVGGLAPAQAVTVLGRFEGYLGFWVLRPARASRCRLHRRLRVQRSVRRGWEQTGREEEACVKQALMWDLTKSISGPAVAELCMLTLMAGEQKALMGGVIFRFSNF
jgi:hypothetical protein